MVDQNGYLLSSLRVSNKIRFVVRQTKQKKLQILQFFIFALIPVGPVIVEQFLCEFVGFTKHKKRQSDRFFQDRQTRRARANLDNL
jgi:hypothetical protein